MKFGKNCQPHSLHHLSGNRALKKCFPLSKIPIGCFRPPNSPINLSRIYEASPWSFMVFYSPGRFPVMILLPCFLWRLKESNKENAWCGKAIPHINVMDQLQITNIWGSDKACDLSLSLRRVDSARCADIALPYSYLNQPTMLISCKQQWHVAYSLLRIFIFFPKCAQ